MKAQTKKALEAAGYPVYGSFVKVHDDLYPMPLIQGNSKLGKDVWHSSILPTNEIIVAKDENGNEITEKGTCPISCKGCYGTTGNYRFNDNKYSLIMRTRLLRNYPDDYFRIVSIQIENESIEKLRIHAVGDFIENEAKGFHKVLKEHPHVKAWTYTKCPIKGDIKRLGTLPNMNIVKSIVPGCGFNFGHIDYIIRVYRKLKDAGKNVYVCRCGIDKNQHCSNCSGCSDHEYVLFIEHSTGYKAEKDVLYADIVKLIESQKGNA